MKKSHRKKTGSNTPQDLFIQKLRFIWKTASALAIALWAGWCLLDAFVIPRDIVAQTEESSGLSTEYASASDTVNAAESTEEDTEENALTVPVITETSYNDSRISIEIRTMRTLSTNIYLADITLTDPDCLRTALAENSFGRNVTETTSSMAERNGAILAVNGDYYGFRKSGYVMRNGYLYRSEAADDPEQEDLVHYPDGSFEIVKEAEISAEELEEKGAVDIFSFGPGLVIDGEISVTADDEVDRAQVTNPRTAFGVISPLHFLFVVSDGRTDESTGLSLFELAELMKELGCTTAYNLDGGGSSTMWFNGNVLNHPTTFGDKIEERSISDIIYIGQ